MADTLFVIIGTIVAAGLTCGYCLYMAVKIGVVFDKGHERRKSWWHLANQLYHLLLIACVISAWLGAQTLLVAFFDVVHVRRYLWFAYNLVTLGFFIVFAHFIYKYLCYQRKK